MKKAIWSLLSLALVVGTASAGDKAGNGGAGKGGKGVKGQVQARFGQFQIQVQRAQPAQPPRGQFQPGGGGGFGRGGELLSERDMEELKLSSEQKTKVQKVLDEYRKAMEGLRGGGQPDFTKLRQTREDAEKKLKEALTEEQQKKLEELRQNRRPGGFGGGGPGGFGGGFGGRGAQAGQVIPSFMKERLRLTEDQQKQVEELEKKVKDELNKILTEEQRKQLEQGFGAPGGPGGGGRPGGGRPGSDQPRRPGGDRPGSDQPRRPGSDN